MGDISDFKSGDRRSFRVRTRSGTQYELSAPDDGGYRLIRREPGKIDKGSTFISMQGELKGGLQSIRAVKRKEFVGRLKAAVSLGTSLYFEIRDEDRNIVSEPVEDIEELTSDSEDTNG